MDAKMKRLCRQELKKTKLNSDELVLEDYGYRWKTAGIGLFVDVKTHLVLINLNTKLQAMIKEQ